MTATRCPCCGHLAAEVPCARCQGTLVRIGDGRPLRHGRGLAPIDLVRGFTGFFGAALHLLHRREFVGRLRLPIAANLVVVTAMLLLAWLWLRPMFGGWLQGEWPLPGVHGDRDAGAVWMALATLWWLGPALLELALGGLLEPLVEVAEQRIGGAGMRVLRQDGAAELQRRVRDSARLFTVLLLALPVVWLLSLVPVAGLPLVWIASAGAAAVAWSAVPLARRQCGLPERLAVLRQNWPFALGFGLATQLAWTVPFLNVLFLAPTSAVAAAALYFRFDKPSGQG